MNIPKLPRGMRNHNPLNIRTQPLRWLGQIADDGQFCIFSDNMWGYRAAFKLIRTYNQKYNLWSVRQIITRWAPPNENNTSAYIKRVCEIAGLKELDTIAIQREADDWRNIEFVAAMAEVENGVKIDQSEKMKIQDAYNYVMCERL